MLNEFTLLVGRIGSSTAIVEGRNDRAALEKLGIRSIVAISGKPLSDITDNINSPVVVLTDFDAEGKKLGAKLTTMLQHMGVPVDTSMRRKFFELTGAAHIEDVDAEKLAAKGCKRQRGVAKHKSEVDIHGKIGAIHDEIHDRRID